jgi:hypothetical protein
VELAAALKEDGIKVDLIVTVDAADGSASNLTVDNIVSDNVENVANFYQTDPIGSPSFSQKGNKSSVQTGKYAKQKSQDKSGTANVSLASHGGKKKAADPKKTDVRNYNVSGQGITHGNVDDQTEELINRLINQIMRQKQR